MLKKRVNLARNLLHKVHDLLEVASPNRPKQFGSPAINRRSDDKSNDDAIFPTMVIRKSNRVAEVAAFIER